ncbi:MAG: P-loop NTPase fold protein [Segatella copri]|nr:P-loop NTPase fold protein [Segatella copri]
MSKQIFDFLNEYAKLPSPQYAVLLRGKWGCGKTYFVKNWLAEFDKSNKLPANENSIELTLIYVSLFGMRCCSDGVKQTNFENNEYKCCCCKYW